MRPFHLAFPVTDLQLAEGFYTGVLGARVGRRSDHWIDFDFFGHQITAHLCDADSAAQSTSAVDGKQVPVRHFGIVMEWRQWHEFSQRLKTQNLAFMIEPGIRFAGQSGEQATLFVRDPCGNCLEFKAFRDDAQLFAV